LCLVDGLHPTLRDETAKDGAPGRSGGWRRKAIAVDTLAWCGMLWRDEMAWCDVCCGDGDDFGGGAARLQDGC
jgi:hypothetical protein